MRRSCREGDEHSRDRRWVSSAGASRRRIPSGLAAAFGALLLAVLIAGCGPGEVPPSTGVRGEVLIGPTCPVVRVGTECPDRPYPSELEVQRTDGRVVARAKTDASGRFEIALRPGDYILVPTSPAPGGPPYASPLPFTVTQAAWTSLTVQYDSGIR